MTIKTDIYLKERKLFVLHKKLLNLLQKIIDGKPRLANLKDGIVCFILAKSFKTYRVVLHLIRNGFSEDAEMLIRTLFDAYIILATVLEDKSDDTTDMFYSFDYVIKAKMFDTLNKRPNYKKTFEERRVSPKSNDESIELIAEKAAEWKEKFKNVQKWHGTKTLGELAEAVNVKQYHETAYVLQSHLIHSLPRVMDRYFKLEGDQVVINVEKNIQDIDVALVSAFNMMILIADRVIRYYNLEHSNEIELLSKELEQSVKGKNT